MTQEEIKFWEFKSGSSILNPTEFGEGVKDLKSGNECKRGMGRDYLRGYHTAMLNDNSGAFGL